MGLFRPPNLSPSDKQHLELSGENKAPLLLQIYKNPPVFLSMHRSTVRRWLSMVGLKATTSKGNSHYCTKTEHL